jgi:hypothetical protein
MLRTSEVGKGARVELSPETQRLLESGSALLVGITGPDGEPYAGRGWGCTLSPDGGCIRLLVPDGDALLDGAVVPGAPIACTATDIRTLQSVQAKGRVLRAEPATVEDARVSGRYRRAMFDAIHEVDGFPVDLLEKLVPAGLTAVTVRMEEFFDQTPGPGAGAPVEADGGSV